MGKRKGDIGKCRKIKLKKKNDRNPTLQGAVKRVRRRKAIGGRKAAVKREAAAALPKAAVSRAADKPAVRAEAR